MDIYTKFKLLGLVALLAGAVLLAACGEQQTIAVFVTPTPAVSPTAPITLTPVRAAVQPTVDPAFTPLPTPLPPPPGVSFGPITGPEYTPEPLHTALPPTLSVQVCRARVVVADASLHTAPELSAPVARPAVERELLTVSQFAMDAAGNEWASTPDGWLLLSVEGRALGTLPDLRACEILRGREANTTLLGLHILNDRSQNEILTFVRRMSEAGFPVGTLKGLNGSEQTLQEAKAISPETVIVYRSLLNADGMGDCPADVREKPDPAATARRWMDGLEPYWDQVDADYYELMNECPASLQWIAQFSIEAMKIANEQGRCLLLFSFPGGNPDMQIFNDLLPAYEYALNNPCAPGRMHGIALHSYSLEDARLTSESDVWIALRHRILHERLLRALPGAESLPVYITEMGIGGGTFLPACELVIRDALQFTYQLEEDPYVKGFHLWNVGSGAQWYDITPCLPQLAEALIRYYTFRP